MSKKSLIALAATVWVALAHAADPDAKVAAGTPEVPAVEAAAAAGAPLAGAGDTHVANPSAGAAAGAPAGGAAAKGPGGKASPGEAGTRRRDATTPGAAGAEPRAQRKPPEFKRRSDNRYAAPADRPQRAQGEERVTRRAAKDTGRMSPGERKRKQAGRAGGLQRGGDMKRGGEKPTADAP